MPKKSFERHMGEWRFLAESVAHNIGDLEHVRDVLEALNQALDEAMAAKVRQGALRAEAQQATRDLEEILAAATIYAVQLHSGVLAKYGTRSEKLREFGLRPRKGPGPRRKAPAAEDGTPAPPKRRRRRK